MWMTIWARLTGGKLVWLKDHDGKVTLTIARTTPFGDVVAKRHWPWEIRSVILLPNGAVEHGAYVVAWKDAENG